MTLDEIRVLLELCRARQSNLGEVHHLLGEHSGHVAARIAALMELEKELHKLRRQCRKAQKAKDCGILAAIGHGETHQGSKNGKRHIAGTH